MTTDPRAVVVAVAADGSVAAVEAAVGEAVRRNCPVQVMHAVDLFREPDDVLDRAVEQARALAAGRVPVTSALHHGSALDGIIAASAQAELLVIQRRATVPDRQRLRAKAISGSHAPVLWVPNRRHPQPSTGTVSVGVHDTLTCGPLIDAAVEIAAAYGARLSVVHVRPEADEGLARRELAATLAAPGRCPAGVEVAVSVLTGRPGALLVEATAISDLLVLGRHHPYRPGGTQLGPVAHRVLSGASCPVLLPTPTQSVSSAAWVFASHLD